MSSEPRSERWHRTVWRWHFYAGLFCVPFILWLSVTGGLYLFKPQIEGWLYAPYRDVAAPGVPTLPPARIALEGAAAIPGAILHKYVLPEGPRDAVQLLVGTGAEETRVWVHPQNGAVLNAVSEDSRFMPIVFRLHGELLAGPWGSALIETAACWAIVMLVSGLFLWWPREPGRKGLSGLLWPRLGQGRRRFWRDLHAVVGLWVSVAAMTLIFSGLPWANNWGDYLRAVRSSTGTATVRQDWSAGAGADARIRAQADKGARLMRDDHAEHHGMAMAHVAPGISALNHVVPAAAQLGFAGPVEVSPPTRVGGSWLVQSQAENRPLRANAEIAEDGHVIGVQRFAQRHWIDRLVGYGIAIHEGAWAGLLNQFLNLLVLVGLVTLSLSSVVMWWLRRPKRRLGAPPTDGRLRHSWALVALVIGLGLLMPMFGLTLAIVALAERALARTPAACWLGLRTGGSLSGN